MRRLVLIVFTLSLTACGHKGIILNPPTPTEQTLEQILYRLETLEQRIQVLQVETLPTLRVEMIEQINRGQDAIRDDVLQAVKAPR